MAYTQRIHFINSTGIFGSFHFKHDAQCFALFIDVILEYLDGLIKLVKLSGKYCFTFQLTKRKYDSYGAILFVNCSFLYYGKIIA